MTRSRSLLLSVPVLFSAVGALGCASSGAARVESMPERPRGDGPSLVVLLVVDQLRGDYLDRFAPVLDGGLAWLVENGAFYTDAHQNHSMTATAPGHATLVTGVEPSKSGVIGNAWFNRETGFSEYSAGSRSSPENLEVTALGDWLKAADPRSKVFSVSGKDRSAIMMGGQRPDAAYWYGRANGTWSTSRYYEGAAERQWVQDFNDEDRLRELQGTAWEPVSDPAVYDQLGIVAIDLGVMRWGFPHVLGSYSVHTGRAFYEAIYGTPFVDAHMADFARALIDAEQLGQDGSPDLLALSFSALDTVGHAFGPDSPEVLDVVVRLDALLGDLLEHLDDTVGLEHIVFALSSDHGVVTLPEVRAMRGEPGKRLDPEDILCVQRAGRRLNEEFGDQPWLQYGFYLDRELVVEEGHDPATMARRLADFVEECDAVARAWTDFEIAALAEGEGGWIEERYRNNYYPGRGPDVIVQLQEDYLYDGAGVGTTHGSVYDYDTWVPVLFAGPGVVPGRFEQRAGAVDVAPTLAAMLGIETPADLHGVDRSVDFVGQ